MAQVDGTKQEALDLITVGYDGTVRPYLFHPPDTLSGPSALHNGSAGKSPSWVSFHPKDPVAYITDEDVPGRVFQFDVSRVNSGERSLQLRSLGSEQQRHNGSETGNGPVASVAIGRLLFIANYNDGSVTVHHLNERGVIEGIAPARTFQFYRTPKNSIGPITSRQDHSYAHQVSADPTGRFVYAPDLGADKVHILKVPHNGKANDVELVGATDIAAGSGPRHIAFYRHHGKTYAYLTCELSTTLNAFEVDESNGSLRAIGKPQLSLPAGVEMGGNSTAGPLRTTSEVAISPDGRFVYVGCRGDPEEDHIAIFERSQKDGSVRFQQWVTTGGRNLRHFSLSSDEHSRYIAAAHQASGVVAILKRDADTGLLTKTRAVVNGVDDVAYAGFLPHL